MKIRSLLLLSLFWLCQANAQTDSSIIAQMYRTALTKGQSYQMLEQLAGGIGGRLSGSPQSYKVVGAGLPAISCPKDSGRGCRCHPSRQLPI